MLCEHALENGQRRFSDSCVGGLMDFTEPVFKPCHNGGPDCLFAWKMAEHRRLGQPDSIRDGLNADGIRAVLSDQVQNGFNDMLLTSFTAEPFPGFGDVDDHHGPAFG